jgi:hypothetical protein
MEIMMTLIVGILKWWSGYYGDHQIVSVAVRFVHVAALIFGGGTALFVDRHVLRTARLTQEQRADAFRVLGSSHRQVVPWLVVLTITGFLMTAADLDTYLGSRVYWIKMGMFGLLLINGAVLLATEKRVRQVGIAQAWSRLVTVSTVSLVLWIGALLMGMLLTVA